MADRGFDASPSRSPQRRSGTTVDVELRPDNGIAFWRRAMGASEEDLYRKVDQLTLFNQLTSKVVRLDHVKVRRLPPKVYDPDKVIEMDLAQGVSLETTASVPKLKDFFRIDTANKYNAVKTFVQALAVIHKSHLAFIDFKPDGIFMTPTAITVVDTDSMERVSDEATAWAKDSQPVNGLLRTMKSFFTKGLTGASLPLGKANDELSKLVPSGLDDILGTIDPSRANRPTTAEQLDERILSWIMNDRSYNDFSVSEDAREIVLEALNNLPST